MKKNLLTITQLSPKEIQDILNLSVELTYSQAQPLQHKNILFAFEKPSLRTKIGTEVAINHLGGNVVHVEPQHFFSNKKSIGREALKDTVCNISQWCDAIFARVFEHDTLLELDKYATIPVINALCNFHHPMQALADLLTVQEYFGKEHKISLAFVGDANNVAFSLFEVMLKLGHSCRLASPSQYGFSEERRTHLLHLAKQHHGEIVFTHNPFEAVDMVDMVYTDVFVSMGEESIVEEKKKLFAKFQINQKLFSQAKKEAIFMHCLPAHRNEEVTDEVIDSKNSVVYQQAKNRMVVSKGVFTKLLHHDGKQ